MYQKIVETAQRLIKENGLVNLSRQALCDAAGIPDGSFSNIVGMSFTKFIEKEDFQDTGTHKITKKRISPEMRKSALLNAAVELAKSQGYANVKREDIADEAGVSVSLTNHYFSNMNQLRKAIMRHAVTNEILEVIAQGITVKDPQALRASDEVKSKALALFEVA